MLALILIVALIAGNLLAIAWLRTDCALQRSDVSLPSCEF